MMPTVSLILSTTILTYDDPSPGPPDSDSSDADADYSPHAPFSSPDLGFLARYSELVELYTVHDVPLTEISRGFTYRACTRYVFSGLGVHADPILVTLFLHVPPLRADRLRVSVGDKQLTGDVRITVRCPSNEPRIPRRLCVARTATGAENRGVYDFHPLLSHFCSSFSLSAAVAIFTSSAPFTGISGDFLRLLP